MARFCTKCGNPIMPGSKFCNKCGKAVEGSVSHHKDANRIGQNLSPPMVQNRFTSINSMVIAIVAVLLISGIGRYFFWGRSPNSSPDMVAKTFASITCDILNGKRPDYRAYNELWYNHSLAQARLEEIDNPRSSLIVPLQSRGEITYLLGKNKSLQKDDKYIRFVGMANRNSKNIYGCFYLAIRKINDKYYIINGGYSKDPIVKNRDYYKES